MRRFKWFLSLSLSITAPFFAVEEPSLEKVYCSRDQIHLSEQTILVDLKGVLLEVDQLQADQGGLFFTREHVRCPYTRKTINPKNTCQFKDYSTLFTD